MASPFHPVSTLASRDGDGCAARFSGGLGVADFLKRTSLVACTPDALAALGPAALTLAEAEGLSAHGRSVSIRLNRRS